ncbi:hypothetical protein BJ508DRAFT_175877 [Ascobolus immersus RN42]|uniref:Uncharacterized protein n=1 Tax=Ascobolus immersus RN42 TaxID=1160509 RepID=A0A3N4HTM0_ASCIM|nr:hypothetical protein BJ508DRAFT_175877 [Ascobolus immersus RN42]
MAEESTGNVETRLGQSAGPSATDADVSTQSSTLAGGETSPSEATAKNNTSDGTKQESGAVKTGNEGPGKEGGDGSEGHETEGSAASPTTKSAAESASKPGIRPAAPLKKPTSFKSVSINQKYLAKATSSTPPTTTSKLAFSTEKGPTTPASTSTTPTILGAKRRLVNKTVGSLQSGAAGAAAAKPVEQKVWTKNQLWHPYFRTVADGQRYQRAKVGRRG